MTSWFCVLELINRQAIDFETRVSLLEQSRDMYLKCLEMCSMNDFALHNYGKRARDMISVMY